MVRSASLLFAAATMIAGIAHAEDPKPAAQDPGKIVCKRQGVTGSLAESTRVCHTRAEWTQIAEANRAEARRVADSVSAQGGTGR